MVAALLLLILCCALVEVFPRPPPLLGEHVRRPQGRDRAELDGVWRELGN